MPLYNYLCKTCGRDVDEYRRMDDRDDAPEHCGQRMERQFTPHRVIADIEPYRTVAVDKETGKTVHISGRKQHREFVRRNGYEEVGSEPVEKLMQHPIRKEVPAADIYSGGMDIDVPID